ncbi:MAG: nitroreductase [Parasphingopyxis sp.]|nr:nitroreductase [Sphingomonadales bacterium]
MRFNDLSTPLSFLSTRRSSRPRDLIAPGPSDEELAQILHIAMRVPDHGKLAPWRFVIVGREQREPLQAMLEMAYRIDRPDAGRLEIEAIEQFAQQAPTLIVALFSPRDSSKIPLWEQQLSAGAVCYNLLAAAHAMGFAGGWVTGWAAYSDAVRNAFGDTHERIAGFIFLGSRDGELEERPRPDEEDVVSVWTP